MACGHRPWWQAAVVLMGLGGADPTGTLVGEGSEKMWKLARSLKHAGVVELMEVRRQGGRGRKIEEERAVGG